MPQEQLCLKPSFEIGVDLEQTPTTMELVTQFFSFRKHRKSPLIYQISCNLVAAFGLHVHACRHPQFHFKGNFIHFQKLKNCITLPGYTFGSCLGQQMGGGKLQKQIIISLAFKLNEFYLSTCLFCWLLYKDKKNNKISLINCSKGRSTQKPVFS